MPRAETAEQSRILSHSAVMAAGTTVSRLSGFVRTALLSFALGGVTHADVFNAANTLPNMLYILVAGGIFNAVLVPQLVRAMRNDPDRGEAYTNRVITAAALFLALVTVVLVVGAPVIVHIATSYSSGPLFDSTVAFTRYCLPQVFFYGMFVLVGQILNARGSFGPMMWAPIANNVVSVMVILGYVLAYGTASGHELYGGYSSGQELLLGLGSTLGIAVQLLMLLPFLRRAGFLYRPRFDLRDSGLGHTLRLGVWTVLFVIVNQIALVVVQRLATNGALSGHGGTGYTIYQYSFLLVMVPHSIITVSLATAMLPRLSAHAAAGNLAALAQALATTLRSSLVVMVPFAALLPVIAPDLVRLLYGWGAGRATVDRYVLPVSLFGLGVLFFTVHYLVMRGFYSLELNRTVFFVQCAVAGTNIVAALVLTAATDARHTAAALVVAYTLSYVVGSLVSYSMLGHRLGGLGTTRLLAFLARLVAATVVATALTVLLALLLHRFGSNPGLAVEVVRLAALSAVDVLAFLALSRLLRVEEVRTVLATVAGRGRALR